MIRPEQIRLDEPPGDVAGTVQSYEYYGHDAVVRVRSDVEGLPDLVVRVTGGACPSGTGWASPCSARSWCGPESPSNRRTSE